MKRMILGLFGLALAGCATQVADGTRLEPIGRTLAPHQATLFCLDHPKDQVCSD